MSADFLKISPSITVLPVIHGSGDFSLEVRRRLLSAPFDCLAVPLPPSFRHDVERAIAFLPAITTVVQHEPPEFAPGSYDESAPDPAVSYVPIDPCQPVIAALRIAMGEHIPRAYVDLETARFESRSAVFPDPYALKTISVEKFAAAVLPAVPPLPGGQPTDRVIAMANRLRELEQSYRSILFVCSILDWPWIKGAYSQRLEQTVMDDEVEETLLYAAAEQTLLFLLGELPFITGLYERARREWDDDDENLSIDGVKEMLLAARTEYERALKSRARRITPQLLSTYFRYVRNLSLIERRMTPDLYSLVVAAQQIAGDSFALSVADVARQYPYQQETPFATLTMGIDRARLPNGDVARMKNRLPGPKLGWRTCQLRPRPPRDDQVRWQMRWNPFRQCSWPPEDVAIEQFRTHVKDRAMAILGVDLARSEKFTSSLKDGLDIRETLRNWHTGDLYVKVLPPTRGSLDCVLMLFDSPADPRDYPWRITWHAEHHDESTLALFATDFHRELVGPGIGLAAYGGAMFLFPPRPIPDVWLNPQFDFADTLEERLLAAACRYSRERSIALLSAAPPGAAWRSLAKRHGKKFVHVPLGNFSQETVQQLRLFHVLNGQRIRSYAAHFIRKA